MRVDAAHHSNIPIATVAESRLAADVALSHVIAEDDMRSLLYLAVRGGVSLSATPADPPAVAQPESIGHTIDIFA